MTDEDIKELVDLIRKNGLAPSLARRELVFGLVESGDPMFLNKIPQPFRNDVIEFGLSLTDTWISVSSEGEVDYSEYAQPLHDLVQKYLDVVPLGKYVRFVSKRE